MPSSTLAINNKKKPLDDVRVRRAIAAAVKDAGGMPSGGSPEPSTSIASFFMAASDVARERLGQAGIAARVDPAKGRQVHRDIDRRLLFPADGLRAGLRHADDFRRVDDGDPRVGRGKSLLLALGADDFLIADQVDFLDRRVELQGFLRAADVHGGGVVASHGVERYFHRGEIVRSGYNKSPRRGIRLWVLFLFCLVCVALLTYVVLRLSSRMVQFIGPVGVNAMTKIMGFLIMCMGVQFVVNGILGIATDPELLRGIKSVLAAS